MPRSSSRERTARVRSSANRGGGAVSEAIRIVVVDDHSLFRRGLQMVLSVEDDLDVVGEASDGAEAVERVEELLPDVVLMDVWMPRRSGIDACAQIKAVAPSTKILMLTSSEEEDDLFGAVRAGANGYLLKDVPAEEVADAVRSVMTGQSLITPKMAGLLLGEFNAMRRRDEERNLGLPGAPRLSPRELEVLRLLARGLPNREIAGQLGISENTVKNHVRNLLEKLQLHSRMEAVVYAVREKIVELS
ncbi:response regulator [Kineococcus endophyticus]|uniref:response regulator n=1 Tax=Kineococcus endophyticus TaxID=1181883 RepID=UPI003F599464